MARRTGRRTDYTWNGAFGTLAAVVNAGGVSQIVLSDTASGTIMRARGRIKAAIDTGTVNDICVVGLGLIVVTPEQLAVGTSAIPNSNDDLDADWLWHGFVPLSAVATATGNEDFAMIEVDSKAMRRMKQGMSVALRMDNAALAGTPAVDVTFGIRMLFGT